MLTNSDAQTEKMLTLVGIDDRKTAKEALDAIMQDKRGRWFISYLFQQNGAFAPVYAEGVNLAYYEGRRDAVLPIYAMLCDLKDDVSYGLELKHKADIEFAKYKAEMALYNQTLISQGDDPHGAEP